MTEKEKAHINSGLNKKIKSDGKKICKLILLEAWYGIVFALSNIMLGVVVISSWILLAAIFLVPLAIILVKIYSFLGS